MTDTSESARDEILARLRRTFKQRTPFGDASGASGERDHHQESVTSADGDAQALARTFGAKLEGVLGSWELVERSGDVGERVLSQIQLWTSTPTEVLSWAPKQLPIPDLEPRLREASISLIVPDDLHDDADRTRAAAVTVGLTSVTAAFASTGSAVLAPGPGRSHAASLLPPYHLMLVPFSRMHSTLEAWLQQLRGEGRLGTLLKESAQIAFVTGPSKSADIELNLTLGVHGPRAVHAIVFDDSD